MELTLVLWTGLLEALVRWKSSELPGFPNKCALCDSHFGMFVFSFLWHLSVCLGVGERECKCSSWTVLALVKEKTQEGMRGMNLNNRCSRSGCLAPWVLCQVFKLMLCWYQYVIPDGDELILSLGRTHEWLFKVCWENVVCVWEWAVGECLTVYLRKGTCVSL